jgi:hypothetical protein
MKIDETQDVYQWLVGVGKVFAMDVVEQLHLTHSQILQRYI